MMMTREEYDSEARVECDCCGLLNPAGVLVSAHKPSFPASYRSGEWTICAECIVMFTFVGALRACAVRALAKAQRER